MAKRNRFPKLNNTVVTKKMLRERIKYSASLGYDAPMWIRFCLHMIEQKFEVSVYEARKTFSKYIYVKDKDSGKKYKVRFSNHKPSKFKEDNGDCDFFVGIANNRTTTTKDAIEATLSFHERMTK